LRVEVGPGINVIADLATRIKISPSLPKDLYSLSREQAVAVVLFGRALEYGLGSSRIALWGSLIRIARSKGIRVEAFLEEGPRNAWSLLEKAGAPRVPDHSLRSRLLYDIAFKVSRIYDGSFYSIIVSSRGMLTPAKFGLISRLEDFVAYRCPSAGKALKAAMDLYVLGIFPAYDAWNAGVPIDSSMVGLSLRSCAILVDDETLELIAAGIPLDTTRDAILRLATSLALNEVSRISSISPFNLYPRLKALEELCRPGSPELEGECTVRCKELGLCGDSGCMISECCSSYKPLLRIPNPKPPEGAWWD